MREVKPAKRRGFISFQNPAGRATLTREDYIYWATFMRKVLKISTEFEYNLPSAKSLIETEPIRARAGCDKLHQGCSFTGCVNLDECLTHPHPSLCLTRATGRYINKTFQCPATDDSDVAACQKCTAWALNCKKTDCSLFTPFCAVCPAFTRGGKTPENADLRKDAQSIRAEMVDKLSPSGFVGDVGASGVLEVKKDNSLKHDGGIEIPTVGRRFHWSSFYQMCKGITDPLMERGAYVDERCGQHFHVLAGYFPRGGSQSRAISELERPVPEIILANLHQLHRRYELAMFWVMSCGTKMETLTRWARFRQSIFPYSALRYKMPRVIRELMDNIVCMHNTPKDGKYASVAYYFSKFNTDDEITTFHFENRIADGAQSPAVITAWAALCYAFVLKAIRCSQYGIVEVGDQEYNTRVKRIQPKLIDGGTREWGSNRHADTSSLTTEDFNFLIKLSKEMVTFMKPELSDLGPAYNILESLAERPCSLRLCAGDNWEKIETDLLPNTPGDTLSNLETQIQELVDLSGITECKDIDEWIDEVAAHLGANPQEVAATVLEMKNRNLCRWSSPIGSVIAL